MKKKGFTLIELLVVVAIIGLLAALAVIALNNARAKARDARRVSDIKQIQTALEMYYLDKNEYPGLNSTACGTSDSVIKSDVTVYMAQRPCNPKPTNDGSGSTRCPSSYEPGNGYTYEYTRTENGSSYTIKYCLGAETGGLSAGTRTATPAGL